MSPLFHRSDGVSPCYSTSNRNKMGVQHIHLKFVCVRSHSFCCNFNERRHGTANLPRSSKNGYQSIHLDMISSQFMNSTCYDLNPTERSKGKRLRVGNKAKTKARNPRNSRGVRQPVDLTAKPQKYPLLHSKTM